MTDAWQVRPERSGWRDLGFSRRHRDYYGFNCPAVDMDFLMIEYDQAKPVACIEYKNEHAVPVLDTHPSLKAIAFLADGRNIPAFYVRYATDFTWFDVAGLNTSARAAVPEKRRMSEYEYVELLYKIRGRKLPPSIAMKLKT